MCTVQIPDFDISGETFFPLNV